MAGTSSSGGRNRRTNQEHRARGTYRKDRHGEVEHPLVPVGVPDPPKPLVGDAADEWQRCIGRLRVMGTTSTLDDAALFQYVCLYAETEALAVKQVHTSELIETLEDTIHGKGDGLEPLTGPNLVAAITQIAKLKQLDASYTTSVRQGRMALRQYLVEFGLTPASRAKVAVPSSGKEDTIESLISH